jgi:hypothetical protein
MRCALGFLAHTGWAAVVALTDEPRVIHRARIEIIAGGDRFVYHAAEKLSPSLAEKRVHAAVADAQERTREAIAALHKELRVAACGVIVGRTQILPPLDAILRSHAMIHTAEGVLYRHLLLEAARELGIATLAIPAATVAKHKERKRIDALGKSLGPPWAKDQKESALAAWLALRG